MQPSASVTLFLAVMVFAVPAAAAELTGKARVIDGDTLQVAGVELRLHGIDAPETGQQCQNKQNTDFDCGAIATRTLRLMSAGRTLRCELRSGGAEAGEPTLAVCFDGRDDLGAQMVMQGWALAHPETGTAYRRAEQAARRGPDGLWKARFVPPWQWRQQHGQ